MNKVSNYLVNFLTNRPLCLLSTVIGVVGMLLGVGFIFGIDEVQLTLLYQNIVELGIPDVVFGVFLFALSATVAITAALEKISIVRPGLTVLAFVWLFASIAYALAGQWWLGVIFLLGFSFPPGYVSYYYKFVSLWDQRKKELRATFRQELEEDRLTRTNKVR